MVSLMYEHSAKPPIYGELKMLQLFFCLRYSNNSKGYFPEMKIPIIYTKRWDNYFF